MNLKKKNKKRGFTLIETLVAISILVVSVAGPLTLSSKGLVAAFFARDQVTAFYLAQEGIEFIRNVRDENILEGSSWLNGLPSIVGEPFTVNIWDDAMASCSGTCPKLLYITSNGLYNYSQGEETKYTRTVIVNILPGSTEAEITVTIEWMTGVLSRTFSVRENIFDWQ
ncbi:MAG: type II secretion system protein [Parcubacteria group bacterium]|nr:type II secretion system protein [Parcubacteria group bacterium]